MIAEADGCTLLPDGLAWDRAAPLFSRLIPNADCRVILVIRHGQVIKQVNERVNHFTGEELQVKFSLELC
jgi:hypothetical protein